MPQKRYADLTPEEKKKRLDYQRGRRKRINDAARAAGVIGAPREKLPKEESDRRRKASNKLYRQRLQIALKKAREAGLVDF